MRAVRIHQRGNSHAITIPTEYLRELGWQLGQLLILHVVNDELRAFAYQDQRPAAIYASPRPLEGTNATAQS